MPRITARISAVLVIVFGLSLTAASSAVPEPGVPQETSGSEPLPAKIVKAWTDAGATAGWMGVTKSGRLRFVVRQQPGELAVVVPAFRIKTWRDNMVSGLPAPGRPYGLNLVSAQVTDAGLKELAGLKSLQSLKPCDNQCDGRGAEGVGRAEELAIAGTCRYQGNGRGVKGVGRAEELAVA